MVCAVIKSLLCEVCISFKTTVESPVIDGGFDKSKRHTTHNSAHHSTHSTHNISEFTFDPELTDIVRRMLKNASGVSKSDLQSTIDSMSIFKGKKYNRCWVAEYLPYWHTQLRRQLEPLRGQKVNFLQIGVFEGLSFIYLMSIFRELECDVTATVIDNFSTEPYFGTETTFIENIKNITDTTDTPSDTPVTILTEDSHTAIINMISTADKHFDFIYCSGSRKPAVCYVDFGLLSKVCKPGSKLLLDTYYSWSSYNGDISPDVVKTTFINAFKSVTDKMQIGQQTLLTFKEPDSDWVVKEKPPDCRPLNG
jgi:hypothetical protein